jgi:hypothetical protein
VGEQDAKQSAQTRRASDLENQESGRVAA